MVNVISPEDLLENEQVQELNGLITTIVSAPFSKELENAFYIGSRDIDDNNIFWLYKVDKRTKENNNIILNGTYSLFDDLKAYDVIRDKRPSNASALVGINAILEGSRWQVGNITSTHTGTANWYYVSRLEAFWEYLENWNVEFKPRMTFSKGKVTGRYIDIMDKRSADYGKWYEHGDKLLQVIAEQANDSLYTAFIGRGKGEESGNGYGRRIGFEKVVWTTASGKPVNKPLNQDYVEIPSATELYGYSDGKPRMTVVIFEDEEDSVKVLEKTYDYALNECRPKLQLKADVLEDGVSELGETCTIIRDDRGIRYKTRVFKLTRDFLNKNKKTVEFGDEIVQSTAKRNSNTAKAIKKQEQQTINWLESLHSELQDTYFNEDGYNYEMKADNEYDLPGGYYSFNAPIDQNPTKVIYLGAGMLAIANSKKTDGSWRFRTWANGDGFTADLMNTGRLNTSLVSVSNSEDSILIDDSAIHINNPGRNDKAMLWKGGTTFLFGGVEVGRVGMNYSQQSTEAYLSFSAKDGQGMNWSVETGANTGLYDTIMEVPKGQKTLRMQKTLNMNGNSLINMDTVYFGDNMEIRRINEEVVDFRSSKQLRLVVDGLVLMDVINRDSGSGVNLSANINMQGNIITNHSDADLKENIRYSGYDALDTFRKFKPREWEWKNKERFGEQTEVGFIAQEVNEVDSTLVTQALDEEAIDGYSWAINETDMNKKNWVATHQLVNEVDRLKEENNTLKQEIEDIKKYLGLA